MTDEQRLAGEIAAVLRKSIIDLSIPRADRDCMYYKCLNDERMWTAELYERISGGSSPYLPSKEELDAIKDRAWAQFN